MVKRHPIVFVFFPEFLKLFFAMFFFAICDQEHDLEIIFHLR